jgi:hypothetical protein
MTSMEQVQRLKRVVSCRLRNDRVRPAPAIRVSYSRFRIADVERLEMTLRMGAGSLVNSANFSAGSTAWKRAPLCIAAYRQAAS